MLVLDSISVLRSEIGRLRRSDAPIGFVPTMGYLHEGHLSLVRLAQERDAKVIASIFVNPTQFNDKKDFQAYPISLDRDFAMLRAAGVHAVFTPDAEMMYGSAQGPSASGSFQSLIDVERLSQRYEGASRPGHFRGVSTVVGMLFNLVQPDFAVFGEKDFQQLRLIEQMVEDLKFNLQIVRGPLIREPDGLAMSSRNVRLSPTGRREALRLSRALYAALELVKNGQRNSSEICTAARAVLIAGDQVEPDYVEIIDGCSMDPIPQVAAPARMIITAIVEKVRLLDNMALA